MIIIKDGKKDDYDYDYDYDSPSSPALLPITGEGRSCAKREYGALCLSPAPFSHEWEKGRR